MNCINFCTVEYWTIIAVDDIVSKTCFFQKPQKRKSRKKESDTACVRIFGDEDNISSLEDAVKIEENSEHFHEHSLIGKSCFKKWKEKVEWCENDSDRCNRQNVSREIFFLGCEIFF